MDCKLCQAPVGPGSTTTMPGRWSGTTGPTGRTSQSDRPPIVSEEPLDDGQFNCPIQGVLQEAQGGGGDVSTSGVLSVKKECSYAGTSGHTLHKRMWEHAQSVWRGDRKSALSKHHKDKHTEIALSDVSSVKEIYEAKLFKSSYKFNTQRYIHESLIIEQLNNDPHTMLLNNKAEWGHNPVRRLINR